mmetsp:Transcript_2666/g.3901  ORF Transcript_2666/g.3901 Transcript_2666/m.3901 type:complete len:597 (+) Transcript_2666:207-1997(+)
MIPYTKGFLGLNLIFRINGSPLYRAAIPGLISVGFYIILEKYLTAKDDYVDHPYGIGVLVTSVSFLVVFRANYGYQRYWEACGSVHHLMSKWLDAVTHTGVFHMQQSHYNHIKPPSFFDNHDLNEFNLRRDRERERDSVMPCRREAKSMVRRRSVAKSISVVAKPSFDQNSLNEDHEELFREADKATIHDDQYLLGKGKMDGGWGDLFNDGRGTHSNRHAPETWNQDNKGFASEAGGRTPSLFLQELTHLASLLVAVAFSTLRSDIENTEAPLDLYKAGDPWPEVDPDQMKKGTAAGIRDCLYYLGGFDRTLAMRVAHNASRPLPVIGGVSANEIAFLQRAKGPSAKVNLAWHWLSEFIMREHLAGSLGNIGPPIVSRLIQFLSDGMIHYNHARKTMFIPFPFPHAQISAFFVFTIMFAVPVLMDEYANNIVLGSFLTFLTVTALAGLHEVARELENPFRNVPNDIPLNTLLAMFNESLITLYAGYHPDHYWDGDDYRHHRYNTTTTHSSSLASDNRPPLLRDPEVTPRKGNIASKPKPQAASGGSPARMEQLESMVATQEAELEKLRALVEQEAAVANSSKNNNENGPIEICLSR